MIQPPCPITRRLAMLYGLLAIAAPARGEERRDATARAAALDTRFAALKAAKSDEEADPVVASIWALWLQSGRTDIDARLQRAMVLASHGAVAPALLVLDEIVAMAPDFAEGWNKRATLLHAMGEYERSKADCGEVLKREPRHFGALAGLALIAMEQADFRTALASYRRALAINPFLKERRTLIPALERKVEGDPL